MSKTVEELEDITSSYHPHPSSQSPLFSMMEMQFIPHLLHKYGELKSVLREAVKLIASEESSLADFSQRPITPVNLSMVSKPQRIDDEFQAEGHHRREDLLVGFNQFSSDITPKELFDRAKQAHDEAEALLSDQTVPIQQHVEKPENIVCVVGQPGIGKTTSAKQWALKVLSGEMFGDVSSLFYIVVRYINFDAEMTVLEFLLHTMLPNWNCSEAESASLFDAIQSDPDVLLIFEGLDEANFKSFSTEAPSASPNSKNKAEVYLKNLLGGKLLPRARKIFTSRPAPFYKLHPVYRPSFVVEILGLTANSQRELGQQICGARYHSIQKSLNENSDMFAYCHVPIHFILTVHYLLRYDGDIRFISFTDVLVNVCSHYFQTEHMRTNKIDLYEMVATAWSEMCLHRHAWLHRGLVHNRTAEAFMNTIVGGSSTASSLQIQQCFSHLIWQEYFAAVYLMMIMPLQDFIVKYGKLLSVEWKVVEKFAFGLCSSSVYNQLQVLFPSCSLDDWMEKKMWLESLISVQAKSEEADLFHACSCAREADDVDITQAVTFSLPKHLHLGYSSLLQANLENLSFVLQNKTTMINSLSLFGTKLEDPIGTVLRIRHFIPIFAELDLERCCLTARAVKVLTRGIAELQTPLRKLSLSWNNIGDPGAFLVGHCIHNIEEVDLESCGITAIGVQILTKNIKELIKPLKKLNLSWNNIGDSAGVPIAGCIHNLEKLLLSGCKLSSLALSIIFVGIRFLKTPMKKLDISWNNIGDSAGNFIEHCIHNLEEVDLNGCGLTQATIEKLTEMLKKPMQMTEMSKIDVEKVFEKLSLSVSSKIGQTYLEGDNNENEQSLKSVSKVQIADFETSNNTEKKKDVASDMEVIVDLRAAKIQDKERVMTHTSDEYSITWQEQVVPTVFSKAIHQRVFEICEVMKAHLRMETLLKVKEKSPLERMLHQFASPVGLTIVNTPLQVSSNEQPELRLDQVVFETTEQLFAHIKWTAHEEANRMFASNQVKEKQLHVEKHGNSVGVVGDAGIGKTTLVKKWALKALNGNLFGEISFFFFIDIESVDFNVELTFLEFLFNNTSGNKNYFEESNILNVIAQDSNVLLIIDGLDEASFNCFFDVLHMPLLHSKNKPEVYLKNLLGGKLLPRARKIFTSRPAPFYKLHPSHRPRFIAQLLGLDLYSRKELGQYICGEKWKLVEKALLHTRFYDKVCHFPDKLVLALHYVMHNSVVNHFVSETRMLSFICVQLLQCQKQPVQLDKLAKLAWTETKEGKAFYSIDDLRRLGVTDCTAGNWLCVSTTENQNLKLVITEDCMRWYFSSEIWQDYFAALHVMLIMPLEEFKRELSSLSSVYLLQLCFGFCNEEILNGLQGLEYITFEINFQDFDSKKLLLKNYAQSSMEVSSKVEMMHVCCWVCEANDAEIMSSVSSVIPNELNLSDWHITPYAVERLIFVLQSRCSLIKFLNVSGKPIGDRGAKHLAKCLNLFEKLDLDGCEITGNGAKFLSDAVIKRPYMMESIALAHNDIDDNGAKYIAECLYNIKNYEEVGKAAETWKITEVGKKVIADQVAKLKDRDDYLFVQQVSQVVDQDGDKFEVLGCTVDIPERALVKPTLIKITAYYGKQAETTEFTPMLKCEPSHLLFNKDVLITLPTCYFYKVPQEITIKQSTDGLNWNELQTTFHQRQTCHQFSVSHFTYHKGSAEQQDRKCMILNCRLRKKYEDENAKRRVLKIFLYDSIGADLWKYAKDEPQDLHNVFTDTFVMKSKFKNITLKVKKWPPSVQCHPVKKDLKKMFDRPFSESQFYLERRNTSNDDMEFEVVIAWNEKLIYEEGNFFENPFPAQVDTPETSQRPAQPGSASFSHGVFYQPSIYVVGRNIEHTTSQPHDDDQHAEAGPSSRRDF